jgi:predicted GNAT family N-acyltransferase
VSVTVAIASWHVLETQLRDVRQRVFTVEQGVPAELDVDGADPNCVHFVARDERGGVLGTARLMPTGQIGRMAVLPEHRNHGIGRRLLDMAVAEARRLDMPHVFLHAQSHAKGFYEKSGFVAHGDEFEEAGIFHVEMTLRGAA